MAPDPFRVLAHAYAAGDERLSELLVQRLFPWTRATRLPHLAPAGAHRAVGVLCRQLGL